MHAEPVGHGPALAAPPPRPSADQRRTLPPGPQPPLEETGPGMEPSRWRPIIIFAVIAAFMVQPLTHLAEHPGGWPHATALIAGTSVFFVILARIGFSRAAELELGRFPAAGAAAALALGTTLLAIGGPGWFILFGSAAGMAGRRCTRPREVATVAIVSAALGVGVSTWQGTDGTGTLLALTMPPLGALLAYSSARRRAVIAELHQTRAELARAAVAAERLRIARDLHDLLGHSLSLITLKAELAGRTIGTDPDRAAREITELETVARRSLSEVRQAVTSYRQPSLAAELPAARTMLASAGIDCRVDAPGSCSLPAAIDALLAWTVREGATNIVRHSGARNTTIRVASGAGEASAELCDDGVGAAGRHEQVSGAVSAAGPGGASGAGGSGLAGLAERASRLGGALQAGELPGAGFRLRVSVPLARPDALPDAAWAGAGTGTG